MNKRTRLGLVRHGQTHANIDQVWHGQTDTALTEHGLQAGDQLNAVVPAQSDVEQRHVRVKMCRLLAGILRIMRQPDGVAFRIKDLPDRRGKITVVIDNEYALATLVSDRCRHPDPCSSAMLWHPIELASCDH